MVQMGFYKSGVYSLHYFITFVIHQFSGHGVHHVRSEKGTYKIPFSGAANECAAKGMVLATKGQLTIAFNQGYEMCACGWVSDKNAYYPMQAAKEDCGSRGINNCGNSGPYDVFCYKNSAKGKFYKPNTTLLKQPKERFFVIDSYKITNNIFPTIYC